MPRRLLIVAFSALLLAALVLLALLSRGTQPEPVRDRVAGDVEEVVGSLAPDDLPVHARGFLATDRPWRAARTMERYLAEVPDPLPEHLVLAARAEGGWGHWPAVLALLEDVPTLETYDDGIGTYLLGRARDHSGDPAGAVEAYRAFLALPAPAVELEAERRAARLRLGLALIRSGERAEGRAELEQVVAETSPWFRIVQADALAAAGDTAAVRQAVAGFDSGLPGLRGWRARVEAALAADDAAEARSLANRARAWARTTDTRAEFLLTAGRIAVQMGDVAAGRDAFRSVIAMSPAGDHAREAAERLRQGEMTPADHLAVARVLVAQGLHGEALDGFERWLAEGSGSAAERVDVHMEHATALFYDGRYREVRSALRPIAGLTRARMLLARAEAHRGRIDDATGIYLDIAENHAGTGTGREGLFLAAGTLHDDGQTERARELYRDVVRRYPGTDRAGLATMRLAGIAFQEGNPSEALRLWDGYRTRYPRGDRVVQATYWAGRAREAMDDSAGAAKLFREAREKERDSYYALRASERLGESFWPIPMEDGPPPDEATTRRVDAWMRDVDLLRTAGFEDAASALADDLAARTGMERSTRYALAEALANRGYSQAGIRLGLGLLGSGAPNLRLLRILYPFPYRTLITEEARDRGLDPFVAAALIRQESMFETRITSPAGARGLMQIMPATGGRLAEAVGMEDWTAELLYHPEVNVHLGIRYVTQHMENYDGSLPSVFSAYNAGSHRVEWWSEYPEYGDDEELFTERIPYGETRNYVKILTRNRALYNGLYGSTEGD